MIVRLVMVDGPKNAVPVLVVLPGTTFGVQLAAVLKFPKGEGRDREPGRILRVNGCGCKQHHGRRRRQ